MLRKIVCAAAVIALLPASGFAQSLNIPTGQTPRQSPEEIERNRIIEQEYRDAASKIPDKKASTDPWGNLRSATTPAKPSGSKQQPR